MTRRCGRCGESKPVDQFAWRRIEKGQLDNYCKPCRSAYHREHYEANRDRYIRQAAERSRRVGDERILLLLDYFRSHPCVDCGEQDAVVLEFDHVAGKDFTIGRSFRYKKWRQSSPK